MAEVIGALAWPIVVLILALILVAILRERAGDLLGSVLGRVRKLSLPGGVSLELTELTEARIGWNQPGVLPDIDVIGGANHFSAHSGVTGILRLLRHGEGSTASTYTVIDLQSGRKWITSRLFVLCALLEGFSNLRYVAFLESVTETRRRFVGVAEPGKVRLRLATRYPRLVHAFGQSYVPNPPPHGSPIVVPDHQNIILQFLRSMRATGPSTAADRDPRYFVEIKSENDTSTRVWEEARWVDGALIEELLEDDLMCSRLRDIDLQGRSRDEKIKLFLAEEGPVVAVVDDRRRFEKLIDRRLLAEKVARLATEAESSK